MRIGMIGLGRMGADMSRRLMQAGHEVVAYDINAEAVDAVAGDGAIGVSSVAELVDNLVAPRSVWLMLPAAFVDDSIGEVAGLLQADDVIIDGGNSHWRDDVDRAARLGAGDLHYVDVGVSGGIWGRERGYCLMIGGDDTAVARLEPIFRGLAPGVGQSERTKGRDGDPVPAEEGWLHCGPVGSGHFVKMVHNGIEYGLMAAYAEGLNILDAANQTARVQDAETSPLREPEYYTYDLNVADVAEVWRRGSVIGSWLLDLTAGALHQDGQLGNYSGHVSDSGEGRWTVKEAIDLDVPAPVITLALMERLRSRVENSFTDRLLSALRNEFGGHAVERLDPTEAADRPQTGR